MVIALRALEDLGALDEDSELRATAGADHERSRRREPERAGARDDEHGDRRREGGGGIAGDDQPADESAEREHEHDRDEDARDPIDEALDRRLSGLGLGHEPGDLRERRLLAHARRTHDEPAERVDRRAGHRGAGCDVDGHGLARQHRLVDRRLALDDEAVRRDLLARTDDEEIADGELADRHRHFHTVPQDVSLLRAELEERANRSARAPPRASLEIATEQDQRRDDRRNLEVDVCVVDDDERSHRPPPGGKRADGDERVHRRRAVPRIQSGSAMEVEARPEDDRCRERKGEPFPALELERHDHRKDDERRGQHRRDDEPPANGVGTIDGGPRLGRRHRVVAGRLHRAEQIGDGHALRIEANGGLLGRIVHRGVDPVELVELALDPVRAGGARHPLEREVDARIRLAGRDGAHAASYPASSIAARTAASSRLLPLHGDELRVEIDSDVVDTLDLGHLLPDRRHAVRAVDRGNGVGGGLAHVAPLSSQTCRDHTP